MKDDRYSADWKNIATTKKQSVNWVCERCGVQCLKPGEGKGLLKEERYRLRMAVHHCDYDPGNNTPENLKALCLPCHLHYHRRQQGNVTPGQLSLSFF
ncbi:HNH endonuclease [Synechocystis sp. PCC 7338]|uniref:HNH endonuclease n=1 Tax=Synechocystis sp. PCC 7338 TaxID=2732530 RepID=UPI001BB082A1|nr:HNH endonuclease [Synechocystis sp. PCC 7338]QUS62568.1 HNH endonuclease [Synechocystis sp. PCC 7338]